MDPLKDPKYLVQVSLDLKIQQKTVHIHSLLSLGKMRQQQEDILLDAHAKGLINALLKKIDKNLALGSGGGGVIAVSQIFTLGFVPLASLEILECTFSNNSSIDGSCLFILADCFCFLTVIYHISYLSQLSIIW